MSTIQASCNFYNQLGSPSPVKINLLPAHWVACTYASTLRFGSEDHSDLLDMTFPERTLVGVELHGHKLELFPYHGRDTLEEEMEESGYTFEGDKPVFDAAFITPELLTLITYHVNGTWASTEHPIKQGCLEFGGKFYGDFSIDVVVMAQPQKPITRPKIGFVPVPGGDIYESPGRYTWDGKPMRCPKKGEHYLSGALPQAWKAPNDLSTEFYIAIKV